MLAALAALAPKPLNGDLLVLFTDAHK
eukprot:COSAG01_NODE_46417_length_400_cov_1.196013_1_plen_26_part_01